MLAKNSNNLVWLDLEMTGLDPDKYFILEIATVVTSPDLSERAIGPNLVIHQPESVLSGMNNFVRNLHDSSGLIEAVRSSQINTAEAELETLNFLKIYVDAACSPLCGNTVSQDRRFLFKYMCDFEAFLNYRHIDVSTLKELAKRWDPVLFEQQPQKKTVHRALDDISESIEELRYYRKNFFRISFN